MKEGETIYLTKPKPECKETVSLQLCVCCQKRRTRQRLVSKRVAEPVPICSVGCMDRFTNSDPRFK